MWINPFTGHVYEHHGIYIGNNEVIDLSKKRGTVGNTSFKDFVGESKKFRIIEYSYPTYDVEKTIKIARSYIGETQYHFVNNNCEHFAVFCKTGIKRSEQFANIPKSLSLGIRVTPAASHAARMLLASPVVAKLLAPLAPIAAPFIPFAIPIGVAGGAVGVVTLGYLEMLSEAEKYYQSAR